MLFDIAKTNIRVMMKKLSKKIFGSSFVVFLGLLVSHGVTSPLEIQYYKNIELEGVVTEDKGVDCCIGGEEKKINYPVLKLKYPVTVVSSNPSKPDLDEPTEVGIAQMHLVLNEKNWSVFKKYKGKNARVLCSPFHAFNGHHMTAVLCEVKSIKGY